MPIHINKMSSEVSVFNDDLPLTPQQIEQLVQLILQRLDENKLDQQRSDEATHIRRDASPAMYFGE